MRKLCRAAVRQYCELGLTPMMMMTMKSIAPTCTHTMYIKQKFFTCIENPTTIIQSHAIDV